MIEEQTLAVLRSAERVLQAAWRWLPYPDEIMDLDEKIQEERHATDLLLSREGELIRKHLKEAEQAVLNIAEHKGSK